MTRHRGWLAFGVLGAITLVLAVAPIARAIANGSALAYAPVVELELAIALLAVAPCLALSRAFERRLAVGPAGWASRAVACWATTLAMLLTVAPGLLFADPRRAVLALAILVAVHHVVQSRLASAAHARRATWLVLAMAAIAPTIANAVFALIFA